ncbi:MAG: hypothetical protein KJ732_02145 [Candidatus Margulisbacteria bacterium]|nr:hypothetical protein [Candidatus Margulisiibacteriota bacterium]
MIEHDVFGCVIDVLERLKIPYMIGGSVAAIAYGEARLTLDMDVVVDMNENQARQFAASFDQEFYVNLDSILEALRSQGHFNLIQSEKGIKVDFYLLKNDAFGQEEFSRKRKEAFDEKKQAIFVSPEDVILKKLEWYKMGESQKHIDDVKGILKISGPKLDLPYIDKWAEIIGVQNIWQKLKDDLQI